MVDVNLKEIVAHDDYNFKHFTKNSPFKKNGKRHHKVESAEDF